MVLINKTCLLNGGYKIDWSQIILILELVPITLTLSKSLSFCIGEMMKLHEMVFKIPSSCKILQLCRLF